MMASAQLVVVCLVVLAVLQLASAVPQGFSTGTATTGRAVLQPFLGKKYKMDKCDNMARIIQLSGSSETESQKMAEHVTFTVVLNADGANYTITATGFNKTNNDFTKVKTAVLPFRLGKEFEIADGKIETTEISQYGNILTMVKSGDDPGIVVGIFTPEQLIVLGTSKHATVSCTFKPEL